MRKKTHIKMLLLGVLGALLTFRKEIHDLTRIDWEDKEEEELEKLKLNFLNSQKEGTAGSAQK